jgi:hypothetical protein
MDHHLAAAKSMRRRISADRGMWTSLQARALSSRPDRPVTFHGPEGPPAIDVDANKRLATILDSAGLERHQDCVPGAPSWSTRQPLGGLLAATMLPKPYPVDHGASSYDVTSHFLPLYLGATVQMAAPTESTMAPTTGRFAVIDARCHRAPEAIERAGPLRCWRSPARAMAGDTLISAGSWIVNRDALDPELASLATGELGSLPRQAVPVSRRDITLLSADGQPTTDHGWTRWWLHARSIPFLEAGPALLETMYGVARSTTLVIADSAADGLRRETVNAVTRLIEEGARVVAWGRSGRRLAEAQSARVATTDFDAGGAVHAPGALLRLKLAPRTAVGLGLDAVVPAMLQRDGIFRVSGSLSDVAVLGAFAGRDTVISGWMSDSARVRDAPAILRVRRGKGELIAFSFRPLFRGQMLVTAPLVHNALYDSPEA